MTKDEIVLLARKADLWLTSDERITAVMRFAELVAAAERSACAQVCELMTHPEASSDLAWSARACAAAIRARGEK